MGLRCGDNCMAAATINYALDIWMDSPNWGNKDTASHGENAHLLYAAFVLYNRDSVNWKKIQLKVNFVQSVQQTIIIWGKSALIPGTKSVYRCRKPTCKVINDISSFEQASRGIWELKPVHLVQSRDGIYNQTRDLSGQSTPHVSRPRDTRHVTQSATLVTFQVRSKCM